MKRKRPPSLALRLYVWTFCMLLAPIMMFLVMYGWFADIQPYMLQLRERSYEAETISMLLRFADKKQEIVMEHLFVLSADGKKEEYGTILKVFGEYDTEAMSKLDYLKDRIAAIDRDGLLQQWESMGKSAAIALERSTEDIVDRAALAKMSAAKKEFSATAGYLLDGKHRGIIILNHLLPRLVAQATHRILMMCVILCLLSLVVSYYLISTLVRKIRNAKRQLVEVSGQLAKTGTSLRDIDTAMADSVAVDIADLDTVTAALRDVLEGD